MRRAIRLISLAALAAIALRATPAWAAFHLVVIDQVFHGTTECPNAQYVMLRTLAAQQIFVNTQPVNTQGADGAAAADFGVFTRNLPNSAAGVAMLIGTAEAAELFGIDMDEVVGGSLPRPDGRVCFGDFLGAPVDCLAYGAFTGDNGSFGNPAAAPALGMALVRQSTTNNNANDFVLGTAAPRNNAGATGVLGSCGGTAPTATPTPSATEAAATPTVPGTVPATATVPPATSGCVGDCNGDGRVAINELIGLINVSLGTIACTSVCTLDTCERPITINFIIAAVGNSLRGCPATPTPSGTILVEATTPPVTPTHTPPADGSLGTRRFSINPESSRFVAVLGPGFAFPTSGVTGYLDLTAGKPNPANGIAFVDITGASEFISVDVPAGGVTVCLRVRQDQLPVQRAGLLSCNGGAGLGINVVLDHNLGLVGACTGGEKDGLVCAGDGDCPGGTCFTAAACSAAGGVVEGPAAAHPGVCNGPLGGALLPGDSGPGALMLAPDMATGVTHGLPVEILLEREPPCGDEGLTGALVDFAVTSSRSAGELRHFNNEPDTTLTDEQVGANFDCAAWTQEDGPGTLVVTGPVLDTPAVQGNLTDLISSFVLDD